MFTNGQNIWLLAKNMQDHEQEKRRSAEKMTHNWKEKLLQDRQKI